MKKLLLYGMMFLLLAGIVFWGVEAYKEAKAYEKNTALLAAQMDVKALAEYRAREWAEKLSFGLYENKERKRVKKTKEKLQRYKAKSMEYTRNAMILLLILLAFFPLLSLRAFTFFGAAAAGIVLFFGLLSPILMVTIHKEVEYLGDVILSFESKSVLGSITKLLESGESVVALVILLFSVLVPFAKTLSMMFVSLFMKSPSAHGIVKFFKVIGKWSMVDVFVVATFLVYLTGNKEGVSRVEAEVGLYFFLAYVIVSMIVSLSAERMLHQGERQKAL